MNRTEQMIEKYARMSQFENEARDSGFLQIAGIDEAGRGPLAGPVVAAACILPDDYSILGLDDSKKLSASKRELLYEEIIRYSVSYSIVRIEPVVIDRINILEATKEAMIQCISELKIKPEIVLVDAVDLKRISMPCKPIIKGDALSNSIAAASILAKVYRDRLMCEYDVVFPGYGFSQHKGYGTAQHYAALKVLGICSIHRHSFLKSFFSGDVGN
jgi:ribonuclease HII